MNTVWRSAVGPHSGSVRPNYPAAPAAARWLSMCLFISLPGSLHWLLGHPRHHIMSRRADRRHDGGRGNRDESGEGRTGILPVSHTHTHTVVTETLHCMTSGCMQSVMQTLMKDEVCVCVHGVTSLPAWTRLYSQRKASAPPPPRLSLLPWRHWQAAVIDSLSGVLSSF